ncbi:MAG TPA: D-glycerate dehydrogenase [Nitrospiria bacterium]
MPEKVFLTRRLPGPVMDRLGRHFQISFNSRDRQLKKSEIIRGIQGCRGLISMLSDPIDAEVISSEPGLEIIANYAVGTNNIDIEAAREKGIVVTNTPGVLTEATADLCWALILSLGRRVLEGDGLVRSGKWTGWAPTQLVGADLTGKTLGIIGFGRIGQAVARRAHGFGLRTLYHSRTRLTAGKEKKLHVTYSSFNSLLSRSDIVSLHCPLTPATRFLIGRKAFSRMKKTALLINTARGPIVEERELATALRAGEIGGAGLDVYEREPLVERGLKNLKNTVLLPHLGSAALETRIQMGWMVLENLKAVFKKRKVPNPVG